MMNAEDFYKVLNKFEPTLEEFNLKRKARNTYTFPKGVKLQIRLDKWGWNQQTGWGFFVKVIDPRCKDEHGVVMDYSGYLEINADFLRSSQLVSVKKLEKHYKKLPLGVQEAFRYGGLINFYDERDLDSILGMILEPLLKYILDWEKDRMKLPQPKLEKPKPLTKAQRDKIDQDFKEMFPDATSAWIDEDYLKNKKK